MFPSALIKHKSANTNRELPFLQHGKYSHHTTLANTGHNGANTETSVEQQAKHMALNEEYYLLGCDAV
jgi:hypothetical protein